MRLIPILAYTFAVLLASTFSSSVSAQDCTNSGACCAHWSATGECLHEYLCGGSCETEERGSNNRICCAHRSATGECLHSHPCKASESRREALQEARFEFLESIDGTATPVGR